MGYIAKAIVRIGNRVERLRIFDAASKGRIRGAFKSVNDKYLSFDYSVIGIRNEELAAYLKKFGAIDCNAHTPNRTEEEAVRLFLELAQMDDDDASTLWVKMEQPKETRGTHWTETTYHKGWMSSNELIEAVCEGWVTTLTPLEVAEAFRDGRIKL